MRKTFNCLVILLFFAFNTSLEAAPQQVKTGMYLLNLYDLNMDEHSFYADFYIWFKWKGERNPTEIEFVNAVEKWGMTLTDYDEEPILLDSGEQYKLVRAEGRFFHSFSLGRFPLDSHELDIQIENPYYATDSLVFVADTAQIRPSLHLVGWEMRGHQIQIKEHDYKTDFGNPKEKNSKFSNLTFSLTMARPFSYFTLKMMLPLLVVMLVSIGALLLHPSYIDTRAQLPIGGLLTAVFLQQSYAAALPDTGYMVLMDKIYLLCYLIISFVLLRVIWVGNKVIQTSASEQQVIHRKERLLALALVLLFCVLVAFLASAR